VNAISGGHLVWPGSGGAATTLTLANTSQGAYEFVVLQYDGSGNFRVVDMTPATAQAIGTIGAGGITRWSFPSVSAYAATVADNGGGGVGDKNPRPPLPGGFTATRRHAQGSSHGVWSGKRQAIAAPATWG